MMKWKLYIITLFIAVSSIWAQGMPTENLGKPIFHNNIYFSPSESLPFADVEVYITIPNSGLQFIKRDDVYRSYFDILIALYKEDRLIAKDRRRDSSEVAEYNATDSRESANPVPFCIKNIISDEYRLFISVTDLESDEKFIKEAEIEVPAFSADSIPLFGSIILVNKEGIFIPGEYYPPGDSIYFRVSFYTSKTDNYSLINDIVSDDSVYFADTILDVAGSIKIDSSLPIPDGLSRFTLRMRLIEDFLIRSERKKDILVATLRYKNYAKDNEELVAQLSLIERGSELKSIRKALEDTPEIVDSLIELFWAVKDPTPNTKLNEFREEFYRRIAIANIRFRSSRTGWKSDRGRIYIIYGEPNDTESHPFDLDNRAYEIWYYYSPKRTFYFEDRWGDGTYELVRQE